jgi:hypothetical protein
LIEKGAAKDGLRRQRRAEAKQTCENEKSALHHVAGIEPHVSAIGT